ncbi:uncharacterized protein LOC128207205 [Mya arenaria]|uniref:uncharacterized protein LOC128207205 n=1 Tax=Mya arenaria TaxID=6604 RepID=UPI0022E887B8|nr:uncharacterized protein LOC128207205 [Mya arenaria]
MGKTTRLVLKTSRWTNLVPCPPPSTNVTVFCDHVTKKTHNLTEDVEKEIFLHCKYNITDCQSHGKATEWPRKNESMAVGKTGSGCDHDCGAAIGTVVCLALVAIVIIVSVVAKRRGIRGRDLVDMVRQRRTKTLTYRNDAYDTEKNDIRESFKDDEPHSADDLTKNDTIKKKETEGVEKDIGNGVYKYIDSSSISGSESELKETDTGIILQNSLGGYTGECTDKMKTKENDNDEKSIETPQAYSEESSYLNITKAEEILNSNEEVNMNGESILDGAKEKKHEELNTFLEAEITESRYGTHSADYVSTQEELDTFSGAEITESRDETHNADYVNTQEELDTSSGAEITESRDETHSADYVNTQEELDALSGAEMTESIDETHNVDIVSTQEELDTFSGAEMTESRDETDNANNVSSSEEKETHENERQFLRTEQMKL